ncbi:hypothetical protein DFH09DRAFT_1302922 [Mycena vulgaris]|nr:hypothetical protein DFH09DRAFT_1302922 [Mycena vulgaris]
MVVCDIPFHPNCSNYTDDDEHDENSRKFWFLILDCGLFTKKSDADLIEGDEVLIFFTRKKAEECWAQHCSRYHDQTDLAHQDDPPKPLAPGPSSPAPPSLRVEAPRQRKSQDDGVEPAASTQAPAPPPASKPAQGPASARASSRNKTPALREAPRRRPSPRLPLFRDDDEPSPPRPLASTPTRAPASTRLSPVHAKMLAGPLRVVEPSRKRTPTPPLPLFADDDDEDHGGNAPASARQRSGNAVNNRVKPGPGPQKRAKAPAASARAHIARTPVPPSTAASAPAPHKRSLSAAPRLPSSTSRADSPPVYTVDSGSEPSSPARAAPAPTATSPSVSSVSSLSSSGASEGFPLGSASSPSRNRAGGFASSASRGYASSVSRGFASSASRGAVASPAGSSGERGSVLLYNSGSRKLYLDPALAVREMSVKESVEVVDYEDVAEFLSVRAGRKVGERA